jgi:TonB family protein
MKPHTPCWCLFLLLICLASFVTHAQDDDRKLAVKAYQSGDYAKASDLFKKITKQNASDAQAWFYLGNTYIKRDKFKDAIAALEHAADLQPKNDNYLAGLAYAYLVSGGYGATVKAAEALSVNPKNTDAHYVIGMASLMNGSLSTAYEKANRIIELDPTYAMAYRLKYQALLASFVIQTGTVLRQPETRLDLLSEAAEALEKYISLSDAATRSAFQERLESLKFFAQYYSIPENRVFLAGNIPPAPDPGTTGIKILNKPRPGYTDRARSKRITGTITLLVEFGADGRIGHILVLRSLEPSLDEAVIKAAREIKFVPPTRNGIPIGNVRSIEYTFSLY